LTDHRAKEHDQDMSDLATVTRRLKDEVGLSGEEARRIAAKLNRLAESVSWATPLVIRDSRTGAFTSQGPANRAESRPAKRKSARKAAKKR
jgi:hypothetical protein